MKKTSVASVAIVGAGRAACGLAPSLLAGGYSLTGFAARTRASATRAVRRLALRARSAASNDLGAIVRDAKVVLICVPDAEIAAVVGALHELPEPGVRGKVVLHTSGAVGAAPLQRLAARGAAVGSLHPLVSFPPIGAPPLDLSGVAFAIDGDPAASRAARALVRAIGGRPLQLAEADRAAYHLAASLVANGMAAMLDVGIDLVSRRLGITETKARAALVPLARSVLQNVSLSGARKALTGPVSRGDIGTVERHVEALGKEGAIVHELYRLLSLHAVSMAVADGRLDATAAGEMRRRLGSD